MKNNKNLILILVMAAGCILTFQNCSRASFVKTAQPLDQQKGVDSDQPPSITDGNPPTQDEPPNTLSNAALEPKCQIDASTLIVYDASSPAPTNATFSGPSLPSVMGAFFQASVIAGTVGDISVSAADLLVNAKSVNRIEGAIAHAEVAAHVLGQASAASGEICLSLQQADSIDGATARLALFGRNENGVRATLNTLEGSMAFAGVHDFDIQNVEGAMTAEFTNSHISRLSGAGQITLVDSVVDGIAGGFSGSVKCQGSSQVLSNPSLCQN